MNSLFKKFKIHLNLKEIPSNKELELFAKTQKYVKFISWIPGLRMVAICNSLSMYASDADSDIDLFIVTEKNRMWLVRILVTLIFQTLGIRRHGKKISKRFCLSFFCTTEGLDFNSFRLENDIYLAYWIYYLKPILDKGNTYEKLRKLNENWTGEFFAPEEHHPEEKRFLVCHCEARSNLEKNSRHPELVSESSNRPNLVILSETKDPEKLDDSSSLDSSLRSEGPFLNLLDRFLKKLFLPKTITHRESLGNPVGVIVNENMLKFHNNDRREEIKKSLM